MNAFVKPLVKPILGALAVSAVGIMCPVFGNAYAADAPDPHLHHHHMMVHDGKAAEKATRSIVQYQLPQMQLVRADGKTVSLSSELDDGRTVVLNFIFTTCTAICPVTSQIFSELQNKVDSANKVHLVSISIDPLYDTPAVLRDYAKKFGAGKAWNFYTGTVDASIAAQRAFNVYRGDKMNHTQVTLLRPAFTKSWIRLDGFASADDLLRELRRDVALK